MRIGLNATCLSDRPSGAKQRFAGIYPELVKELPESEFVVYEPADCSVSSWFGGAPNVTAERTPIPSEGRARKLLSGLGYWHGNLARKGFELFEGFNLPLVKAPTGLTLLTIHDIRRLHPEWGAIERAVYRAILERSLKEAAHVITVSNSMKEEILGFYPGVPISVIYNGLDLAAFERISGTEQAAMRKKFALPAEFLLTVGHFEKRKNYLRLVDAIARLRDMGRSPALVIIGNDSGERRIIEKRIKSARLSPMITILSGLTDGEVRCAYKLCSLLIFPSFYEGFGIPILEAMAAGRPMVLSDLPVFREITQDKGVYFSHDDVESMAHAIEQVLSSSSERARLIGYGYERVQSFGFRNLATQVASLYRALL